MEKEDILKKVLAGDINSFQTLFAEFQNQLRSYPYRLLTDRNDVQDLTHDTFIRAFDKIATFNQNSSLKTWVFRIATNLAYDHLRKLKRWPADAHDQGANLAITTEEIGQAFRVVHQTSNAGAYEMKEHIVFCFTCISKTLPIENQVAMILKGSTKFDRAELFKMRTTLVKAIDPLHSSGTDFHELIFRCTKTAIGEISDFFDVPQGKEL